MTNDELQTEARQVKELLARCNAAMQVAATAVDGNCLTVEIAMLAVKGFIDCSLATVKLTAVRTHFASVNDQRNVETLQTALNTTTKLASLLQGLFPKLIQRLKEQQPAEAQEAANAIDWLRRDIADKPAEIDLSGSYYVNRWQGLFGGEYVRVWKTGGGFDKS
jgi:hypothetical protein